MSLALAPAVSAQNMAARVPLSRLAEVKTIGLIQSTLRGRVVAVDSAGIGLSLTPRGTSVRLPWENVGLLQWTPERSHSRGALDGALIGLILGATLYLNSQPWNTVTEEQKNNSRRIAIISVGAVVASTAIGLTVGSHRWKGVSLPRTTGGDIELGFHPDDAVRVDALSGRVTGRSATAAGDSLRLVTMAGPVAYAWRNVGDVQVRGGNNRVLGVLFGVGSALAAQVMTEAFVEFSKSERVGQALVGGTLGYFYLSPEGWRSLPQPRR
jgi:hypothetical protein